MPAILQPGSSCTVESEVSNGVKPDSFLAGRTSADTVREGVRWSSYPFSLNIRATRQAVRIMRRSLRVPPKCRAVVATD